ncbi:hypothetical protein L21SP4_01240 [Kiritimatiella glycovorans]|uniref:Non-reducing end beta-L-arabinofuranosidase n=2 Tax=Kiritimatiella glycovorans TaxID=1307763 RepID=A0A0G3EDV5_9BACT|nr:hypothetical protein L21SP4_01240 [Kiritimatiella glycovorans]
MRGIRVIGLMVAVLGWGTGVMSAAERPVPVFEELPFGTVRPGGWIQAQLERDAATGVLPDFDKFCTAVQRRVFASKAGAPKGQNSTEYWFYDGAHEGYWMDSLARASILSQDEALLEKAEDFVNYLLESQEENGYLGVYPPELRLSHVGDDEEFCTAGWTYMGLLAWYEGTGDARVLEAVERAMGWYMDHYNRGKQSYFSRPEVPFVSGPVSHGLVLTEVAHTLYRITGNEAYRDYMLWIYEDFEQGNAGGDDIKLKRLLDPTRAATQHGVHWTEQLRIPVWAWYATGDPKYREAAEAAWDKTREALLPSFCVMSDEGVGRERRLPTPETAYEYCDTMELTASALYTAEKTGESRFADLAERCFFNAAQAGRLPDGTANSYFTIDNRYAMPPEPATRFRHNAGHYWYRPVQGPPCCSFLMFRIAPYYTKMMWMKTADGGGLAAVAYGPSRVSTKVNGTGVTIREETDYPFSDTIRFTVEVERPVSFELWLRRPGWARREGEAREALTPEAALLRDRTRAHRASQADMTVTAPDAAIRKDGDYWVVSKQWKSGHTVTVEFSPVVEKALAANGEYALRRGSLVYALSIPAEETCLQVWKTGGAGEVITPGEALGGLEETVIEADPDSRLQSRKYTPKEGAEWTYWIHAVPHGKGARQDFEPVALEGDPLNPWEEPTCGLRGRMVNGAGEEIPLTLVPMGSTILRRTTFPKDNP